MDAYSFWTRVDEKNPFATLKKLTDECGIDYRRVKKNRSDGRLPNLEDAYLLSLHTSTSMEYLLTGLEPLTVYKEVYEYMEKTLPSLLEDIQRQIGFKKEDGSSGNRA